MHVSEPFLYHPGDEILVFTCEIMFGEWDFDVTVTKRLVLTSNIQVMKTV